MILEEWLKFRCFIKMCAYFESVGLWGKQVFSSAQCTDGVSQHQLGHSSGSSPWGQLVCAYLSRRKCRGRMSVVWSRKLPGKGTRGLVTGVTTGWRRLFWREQTSGVWSKKEDREGWTEGSLLEPCVLWCFVGIQETQGRCVGRGREQCTWPWERRDGKGAPEVIEIGWGEGEGGWAPPVRWCL
jgi:hypothetical protein